MARWIFFLILLTAAVLGVVWFVQHPGDVTLEWQGRRIDTSVGVLLAVVALIAVVTALVYRFWRFLRAAPAEIGHAWRNRKHAKGMNALGSGMVAVAAGDAGEARRHARRAEALLEGSTPLTRLLSAQSAQLDGDEKAAERFFTEMLDDPETKFLGLRGLLTQALKRNDRARALQLAAEAHALRPKSEWVAETLFDLQSGAGNWIEAESTANDMLRHRLIERPAADRHRAVIAFEMSKKADAQGHPGEALKHLRSAADLAPDLIPAVAALMYRHVADGNHRKAAALGEKVWAKEPHPDLLDPYWEARKATDGLTRVKATEKLVQQNADHLESHIALARAALGASLWGEARKHLGAAGAGGGLEPPARVCRMMAELEERENSDLQKAREWLVRSASAPADPRWVCAECGNAVEVWTAHCGNCHAFDGYAWREPPHKSGLPAPQLPGREPASTAALETENKPALAGPEDTAAAAPQRT